ncbi:Methyltransf-25 domain-containing protein [Favolaschia claudopus]|uniref:Methyltransf-25 domain-containing protein n=1 Tax=Favolaschia claudopus TaxID=2862362 RepID=A0AAW0CCX8_9AGAR
MSKYESAVSEQSISVPVLEAYELWAKTYDSDGNVLQLLDTELAYELLPNLLSQPQETVVDLGCGTGRNIEKLLQYPSIGRVFGLDGTPAMLAEARSRMQDPRLTLQQYNILTDSPPITSFLPSSVDAVISTLVIEHLPSLPAFFDLSCKILRSGGWLLVTNMHEDMGAKTGAGFYDENGVRVRMEKFAHTEEEVLNAGLASGLELQRPPMIRQVKNEEHAQALGARAGKWIGINMLYGMIFVKPK